MTKRGPVKKRNLTYQEAACLNPPASLLCKLASIAVHAEEAKTADGHAFDLYAMVSAAQDSEVQAWLKEMRKLALIPVRRSK